MIKKLHNKKTSQKGFTLIEMLIAVAIFALFLSVAASSLVSVIKLEQKTNVLRQTQQDTRYILETISREARSANGELDSAGDRVGPAYSFNPGLTILTITSTDTVVGKVTQREYSKNGDLIQFVQRTKTIDGAYGVDETPVVLNDPNYTKIDILSFVDSKPSVDLAVPPELSIEIAAESGKGRYFVKDEYRAYVDFKTHISPRNY